MISLLSEVYPYVKALHIIAVISWMAGLFYLPRLFVHHTEQAKMDRKLSAIFEMMEIKLLSVIMRPAMVVTWFAGVALLLTPGIVDWSALWPYIKLGSVILMPVFHIWCAGQLKRLKMQDFTMSGRQLRLMNEVPTVLLLVIVITVIVKPF